MEADPHDHRGLDWRIVFGLSVTSAWIGAGLVYLSVVVDHRDDGALVEEYLYGTPTRKRHSENFKRTFDRLLDAADAVDTDGMVRGALLEGSASGLYYRILRHVSGEELLDPLTGRPASDDDG